jgi:Leucine-rich repeat (LRR) protein
MFTRLQPCFQQGPIEFRCIFGFSFQGTEFDDYTCYLRELIATDMGRAIDLTGFHLQSRTNADVRYLWMDSSDVRFFVNQMFLDFINLRGVHITHSNLEAIQPGAFQNATNLRYIYIIANAVRRLEANTFQHAFGLETIHMWFNRLDFIHENAFFGLTNLRELHLQGGNLNTIPPTTFVPLPNLQYFDASTNKIEVLSGQWFANNTRISQLIFNFNEIYAINQNILEVGNLTTLGLLDNVCVDAIFHITDANRDQVRDELNPCFEQYPLRSQRFILELEGDLTITDVNGTVIGNL